MSECASTVRRLDLTSQADLQRRFTVEEGSERRLPDYIPPLCSIRYVLTYCLDIRRVPGRVSRAVCMFGMSTCSL